MLEKHEPVASSPGLSLQPIQEEAADEEKPVVAIRAGAMLCPKCELEQPQAEQCIGCGVYMHKVQSKTPEQLSEPPVSSLEQSTEQTTAPQTDDSSTLKQFLFPLGVAVLDVLLWKFIAVTFAYEFGLIAWLIGGAIGFSAAMAGAKGQNAGIVCAVLLLLSIFGGKYMAYASFQEEAAQMMASATDF